MNHDVIIAGGGFAGLSCALAMSAEHLSTPLRTLVVEQRSQFDRSIDQRDPRSFAITQSSRHMLEALGVWQSIESHAQPMNEIIVTDHRGPANSRPVLLQFGEGAGSGQPYAWMVESYILEDALLARAKQCSHIELLANADVSDLEETAGGVTVGLRDGRNFFASLMIAADGRNSRIRQLAGIEVLRFDYKQHAIALTVSHEHEHFGCAQEHFTASGPFAILPLPGRRCSIVWSESSDHANEIMKLDDRTFLSKLTDRFGDQLGELRLEGPRASWPLGLQVAKGFSSQRLALIADAAHVIHPIAGLGFNLGLRDIAALAECTIDTLKIGLDPGAPTCLERYERWRRADTWIVAAACDGLNRLFSNDVTALALVRRSGLALVDRIMPLKDLFQLQAAGTVGQTPKLMAGESL